jgi:hypothetical protein
LKLKKLNIILIWEWKPEKELSSDPRRRTGPPGLRYK